MLTEKKVIVFNHYNLGFRRSWGGNKRQLWLVYISVDGALIGTTTIRCVSCGGILSTGFVGIKKVSYFVEY